MRQDVVIVTPGNLKRVYQGFADEHAIEPPVFARWIAAFLLRRNYKVDIVDPVVDELTDQEVADRICYMFPKLVVIAVYGFQPSASTQNMPAARSVAQAIREKGPNLKIIMLGTHPAALPERTLREEPVDFVCDGEGPLTILGLLEASVHVSDAHIGTVDGVWYMKDGEPTYTQPAPLMRDLDREPSHTAWYLTPPTKYRAHDWHVNYRDVKHRTPYASILTTLGCPFSCPFCCIQAPFKSGEAAVGYKESTNSYRQWSPEVVMEEIELLVEHYGVTNIKVHDEMFVLNPGHVKKLTTLIRERYGDTLNIWAYARIDTTRSEFLDMLRGAGFKWLGMGIEAAASEVRDGQDKAFTDEDIYAVVKRVHAAGINVGANYIFGLPNDTAISMGRTLSMAKELNTVFANFYSAMPYPGSGLYRAAREQKLSLPDDPGGPGWIGYSQHSYETMPIATNELSSADILRFRDRAWREYYSRPEYVSMLRERLGEYSEEAVRNIERTLSVPPLRRKILGM